MNIRDLEYLVCVASLGHFGKAAQACFVSQPALSMQIKKLEASLGVQLFERNNKSVLLTEVGVNIVAKARKILQEVDELREVAKIAIDPFAGSVRLGIFPTLSAYLLHHIMPVLSACLPKMSFYLIEEKTDILLEKLKTGEIDAAILSLPLVDNALITKHLFEEAFLLAVPHTHPFAKQASIKKAFVESHCLLLLDEGHCMRNQVMDFCNHKEKNALQTFRATSLETLRYMVASGLGITLMPKLSTQQCRLATYVPFSPPKPTRTIVLAYRALSSKKRLLETIEYQIKNVMDLIIA